MENPAFFYRKTRDPSHHDGHQGGGAGDPSRPEVDTQRKLMGEKVGKHGDMVDKKLINYSFWVESWISGMNYGFQVVSEMDFENPAAEFGLKLGGNCWAIETGGWKLLGHAIDDFS